MRTAQLEHEIKWLKAKLRYEVMSTKKRKEYEHQIKHKELTLTLSKGN
jgi:hypothetical protein|tara:strand:- start:2353 stop:2496 length:144 start_codon:yes stop_codon:yes gene_type:complete